MYNEFPTNLQLNKSITIDTNNIILTDTFTPLDDLYENLEITFTDPNYSSVVMLEYPNVYSFVCNITGVYKLEIKVKDNADNTAIDNTR